MRDPQPLSAPGTSANEELTRGEEEHEIVAEAESQEGQGAQSPNSSSAGSQLEEETENEIAVEPAEEEKEDKKEVEEGENAVAVKQSTATEAEAKNKKDPDLKQGGEVKAEGGAGVAVVTIHRRGSAANTRASTPTKARRHPTAKKPLNEALPVPVHNSRGLQRTESEMEDKQTRRQERTRSNKPSYAGYFEEQGQPSPTNSGHMTTTASSRIAPEALQRGARIHISQPQLQPGAYPAGRSAWESYHNEDNDLVEGNETSNNSNSNLGSISVPVSVPVANPVSGEPSDLELAEAQQVEDQEGKKKVSFSRSDILWIVVGTASVLFAVVLVLVFSLAGSGGSEDSEELAPGKSATNSTTFSSEELFLKQLPFQTIQSIELDSQSPQAKAMDWLIQDPSFDQYPVWRQVQRFALATFFFSTGGQDHWFLKRNWLDYSKHECEWFSFEYLNLDPELNRYCMRRPHIPYLEQAFVISHSHGMKK